VRPQTRSASIRLRRSSASSEHTRDEQDAALLLTAAFTGVRASELRALRWRSVDVANSLIHVERGFTDEGGEDLPKSYRVRSVPLMPQVALELTKLRRRELFTHDDDLVFAGPTGKVLNDDSLVVRYKAAQKAAGLRPLRFHDLRHSFGTMAVRQFPITDVQTWMGHADIATTRKSSSTTRRSQKRLRDLAPLLPSNWLSCQFCAKPDDHARDRDEGLSYG
jgi:integrase